MPSFGPAGESADEGEVEFRLWFKFVQYKGQKAVQVGAGRRRRSSSMADEHLR